MGGGGRVRGMNWERGESSGRERVEAREQEIQHER